MPSPTTSHYHESVVDFIRRHAQDPEIVAQVETYAETIAVLLSLDLEPARPLLMRCYAKSPRGGHPWDPIVLLRTMLLALLIGITSLNRLVPALRGSRLLRVLAGLPEDAERAAPGVGTHYDFLHRIHDGRLPRRIVGYVRPSVAEREAARTPRVPGNEKPARVHYGKKGSKKSATKEANAAAVAETEKVHKASERALREIRARRDHRNPDDFLARMSALLWRLAVRPSAQRGLLGDLLDLVVCGDGSPLVTGATGLGKRTCTCDRRKPCTCMRTYADPDARSGWDPYRKLYFFGHHFYELDVSSQGHDLPIHVRLDAGNTSDHVAGLLALEHVRKHLRDEESDWKLRTFIADTGHDGACTYELCGEYDIRPVIPLNGVPARHPTRPELRLSDRAVPLCQAHVEMAAWGSSGQGRPSFICPVKAGKLPSCPIAPSEQPAWLCQPATTYGPVVNLATKDDPRLFPIISRNSPTFTETYKLRTGCERSNAMKKCRFKLEAARHRRASFWLIRLHLIAILQHALAWVAGTDPRAMVRAWLQPELSPTV